MNLFRSFSRPLKFRTKELKGDKLLKREKKARNIGEGGEPICIEERATDSLNANTFVDYLKHRGVWSEHYGEIEKCRILEKEREKHVKNYIIMRVNATISIDIECCWLHVKCLLFYEATIVYTIWLRDQNQSLLWVLHGKRTDTANYTS